MNYHRANGSVKVLHIKLRFHGKLLHNLRCVHAQLPSKCCCGARQASQSEGPVTSIRFPQTEVLQPGWPWDQWHALMHRRYLKLQLQSRFAESSLSAGGGTENSLKEDKHHIPWLQCTHEARDSLPSKAAGRQAQEQVAGSTLARGKDSVFGVRNSLMLARPQASRSIFANYRAAAHRQHHTLSAGGPGLSRLWKWPKH